MTYRFGIMVILNLEILYQIEGNARFVTVIVHQLVMKEISCTSSGIRMYIISKNTCHVHYKVTP